MIFDAKFLDLPRDRCDMIRLIRVTYSTDPIFHRKVNRILDKTGLREFDRILVKELLLCGEFFLVQSNDKRTFRYLIDPEEITIRMIPGRGRKESIIKWNDTVMEDVIHVFNLSSPYDIRGTPYFNLATFEPREFRFYRNFSEERIIKDIREKVLSVYKPTFFEYTAEYINNITSPFNKRICKLDI